MNGLETVSISVFMERIKSFTSVQHNLSPNQNLLTFSIMCVHLEVTIFQPINDISVPLKYLLFVSLDF